MSEKSVKKWSEYIIPIEKGTKFNTAVLLGTNIFTEDITATSTPSLLRIYVCLDTKAKLTLKRTKSEVTVSEAFNQNLDMTAGCNYIFDTLTVEGESFNLQVSANCTVLSLVVVEIPMVQ